MFENRDYDQVIGNQDMPFFNQLAEENVQFTNYYAVTTKASLPNYIALIGGDTFGIENNCKDCWIDAQPAGFTGRLEAKPGKPTRKTCLYRALSVTKGIIGRNTIRLFTMIRSVKMRSAAKRVSYPSTSWKNDLQNNELPDFIFITPDMCNGGHDCDLDVVDEYLRKQLDQLMESPALGDNYMIFIAFEESKRDKSSCCGMPDEAGGRVPALLISPQAQKGYQEDTPLSHYSLLKTILGSWGLGDLGHTADPETLAITAPWQ